MRPVRIPIPASSNSALLFGGAGRITWYSFSETTGAAGAQLQLIDGSNNTGALIMPVNLNANESTREAVEHHGIPFSNSLYLNILSGTVNGSLVIIDERDWVDWSEIVALLAGGARNA